MIAESPTNINAIAEQFNMSRPAVSKHIKLLENNQLIKIKPDTIDTRQRIFHAQLDALKEVEDYLTKLEAFWNKRLKGLGDFLDNQPE